MITYKNKCILREIRSFQIVSQSHSSVLDIGDTTNCNLVVLLAAISLDCQISNCSESTVVFFAGTEQSIHTIRELIRGGAGCEIKSL